MKLKIYEELKQEALNCKNCDLGCQPLEGQDPHVVGGGNVNSKIMFVAEAPGKQETIHKECLTETGTSGKVYKRVLDYLGYTRDQVYTTNVLVCRPENNADPEPYQVMKCKPFFVRQLELVKPELVITFGRFAAQNFINDFKITRDRGKIQHSETYGVSVFPLYHPSYISSYAPKAKREEFNQDVKKLKEIITEMNKNVA
jgi:DNA polymerase